jgi:hypothetical protein
MNTAARIEQACRTTGHALLASKLLLDRTPQKDFCNTIGTRLRHANYSDECRLSGAKRKKRGHSRTVAFDPTET